MANRRARVALATILVAGAIWGHAPPHATGAVRLIASRLSSRYQIPVELAGLPRGAASEVACSFARAAADYPDVAASVRWLGSARPFAAAYHLGDARALTAADHWAAAISRVDAAAWNIDPAIVINEGALASPAVFRRAVASSIRRGIHPPGHEGIAGVVRHEFGHHVWWVLGDLPGARAAAARALGRALGSPIDLTSPVPAHVRPTIARGLSRYASTSWEELAAEAFVEWSGSPHPRPLATALGVVVDRYLKHPNAAGTPARLCPAG